MLEFERNFDVHQTKVWMDKNWALSFYFSFGYLIFIYTAKRYMKNRRRYEMKGLLIIWNMFLAAFSFLGAIRTITDVYNILVEKGFRYSCCVAGESWIHEHKVTAFWAFWFTMSKVLELGDTVFVIMRKQKLMFLHWYHHMTVLLYTWYNYSQFTSTARWFMLMNFCVHAVMYSYYACKAMRLSVPKWVAACITIAQISQMLFGIYINKFAYDELSSGHPCDVNMSAIYLALFMYFTYFILFVHFFYKTYIYRRNECSSKQAQKQE